MLINLCFNGDTNILPILYFLKKKNNHHNNNKNNSGSSQSSIACIKPAFNIAKTTLDVNVCLFVVVVFFIKTRQMVAY